MLSAEKCAGRADRLPPPEAMGAFCSGSRAVFGRVMAVKSIIVKGARLYQIPGVSTSFPSVTSGACGDCVGLIPQSGIRVRCLFCCHSAGCERGRANIVTSPCGNQCCPSSTSHVSGTVLRCGAVSPLICLLLGLVTVLRGWVVRMALQSLRNDIAPYIVRYPWLVRLGLGPPVCKQCHGVPMTSQTPTAAAAAPTTLTLQALDDAIGKAQEAPDAITKQAAAFGTSAHEIIDQCVSFFTQ